MQPLEKEILQLIRQEQLINSGERVLIGVSGGPDSMTLLHVLAQLASILDITLAVAYVNHGLRPDEAEAEKNLVEAATENLGINFSSGAVDVLNFSREQKISVEHAARLLRYDFFEITAAEWGATKIAVAHTADDQAEEILIRLIRGTARKGLSGMKTLRDGRIVRPLLRTPKSRLLAYLEQNSVQFLLDSSNTENAYLRNRIRNELLPYLTEDYNPDIRQTLLRTANILQDEEELLENITESAFKKTVSINPMPLEKTRSDIPQPNESNNQELFLTLERINREPRAIQRRLLEKCCWEMGCEARSRQIEHLLEFALKIANEGTLHLSNGLRVIKDKDRLCFAYPRGRGSFRGNISDETETEFPETSINAPGVYEFPQLGKILVVEYYNKTVTDSKEFFSPEENLDSSLFSFPLTLRGPMPGDRFHPLGAPGSKKVSDFLSDQKVERYARGQVPVLCADETIIALPGLRIDNRYKVTKKTTRIVRVCWEDFR